MNKLKLAVFASGGGTNFQAIYQAIHTGKLKAQIQVVISNNKNAGALEFARRNNLNALHLSRKQFQSAADFDIKLSEILDQHQVNFIILAGYMKKLRPLIIQNFQHRILNIHPALLPSFGGKGMYGHFVHEAVLRYGCKLSGVTVHLVDEEYDHGPIVMQQTIPVQEDDSPETLAARILKIEHRIYAQALQLFAEERVEVVGRRAVIHPAETP